MRLVALLCLVGLACVKRSPVPESAVPQLSIVTRAEGRWDVQLSSDQELDLPWHPVLDVVQVRVETAAGGEVRGVDPREIEEPPGHPEWFFRKLLAGQPLNVLGLSLTGGEFRARASYSLPPGRYRCIVWVDSTISPPLVGGWRGTLAPVSVDFEAR